MRCARKFSIGLKFNGIFSIHTTLIDDWIFSFEYESKMLSLANKCLYLVLSHTAISHWLLCSFACYDLHNINANFILMGQYLLFSAHTKIYLRQCPFKVSFSLCAQLAHTQTISRVHFIASARTHVPWMATSAHAHAIFTTANFTIVEIEIHTIHTRRHITCACDSTIAPISSERRLEFLRFFLIWLSLSSELARSYALVTESHHTGIEPHSYHRSMKILLTVNTAIQLWICSIS